MPSLTKSSLINGFASTPNVTFKGRTGKVSDLKKIQDAKNGKIFIGEYEKFAKIPFTNIKISKKRTVCTASCTV